MKLSLIVPAHADEQNLVIDYLQNADSFFARLPFELELLFVIDHASDQQKSTFREHPLASKALWVFNKPHLGRAGSLEKGLRQATGDIQVALSVDNSVPLAEIVTVLQEMLQSADWDVLQGNRFTSRKKLLGQRSKWHRVLEDIIHEKAKMALPTLSDPSCSFLALTKLTRDKIFQDEELVLTTWFYSIPLLMRAKALDLKIQEVPIQSRKSEKSKIPLLREFFRHLF